MNRTEKVQLAKEFKEKFNRANVAFFADYKGITAVQADQLRGTLRPHQVEVKVLKNNIARIAAQEGSLGDHVSALLDTLTGPTLVAFVYGDLAAAAKAFHKFAQDHEALKIKESLMGKKLLLVSEVEELAKLPAKEVLLAKLMDSLNAPMTNFVGILAAVPRSFITVLAAIEKKKG